MHLECPYDSHNQDTSISSGMSYYEKTDNEEDKNVLSVIGSFRLGTSTKPEIRRWQIEHSSVNRDYIMP